VAGVYVVVSWMIIQVVSVLNAPLSLPDWFEKVVIVLLAIGFPVAMILAWAFEMSPEGVRPTQSDQRQSASGNKLDYALVAALLAVVATTAWNARDTGVESGRPGPGEPASIAVLPFVDMSPTGDQEYFGDGIAEELLNQLVRLDGLRVAGRTSSFAYKGSNSALQDIGAELGVSSILEGSVRKDGERLRITAQLIKVSDGFHLWSETYDRDFDRIFEIQEEISEEVAGALGVRLGVGDVNAFTGAGTDDVEAYELYLRASNYAVGVPTDERRELLERVIEIDPEYAAAWASLGLTIAGSMWYFEPERARQLVEEGYRYVSRAVELDPESALALSLLGTVSYPLDRWIEAQRLIDRSIALRRDRTTLGNSANLSMRAGRISQAQRLYDEQMIVEPLGGRQSLLRMHAYLADGRFDEARDVLQWDNPTDRAVGHLEVAMSEKNPQAVRASLEYLVTLNYPARSMHAEILAALGEPGTVNAILDRHLADSTEMWPSKYHDIAMVAAYFDDPELAIEAKAREVTHTPVRAGALWHPVMSGVRQLPEFKSLVSSIGLVEYWREYGWANACRPVGADDFECR
jgi:TolB-like protein/tetratricopeptide (TPR) repeat protein